mmetsp:Transcript_19617/g.37101  ORF Transcript_19617/g.37101 Transcript_19617/m.37101 type:complete len:592 (-) Transcript_19617:80-1855(-)
MKFPVSLIVSVLLASGSEGFVPHHATGRNAWRPLHMAEVTVRRLPDSAVEIDIPVPGSATKAAYDKVCTELSKQIQIPGFRKGSKIPPQVLEQSMAAKGGRNALKVQAINELLQQLVERTLKEQSLDPIGQASLKIPAEELADSYKPGEDLTLPVRCDVWPEIQWKETDNEKPYVGLKGKYARKPFNQERLDTALRDLKERYVSLEPVTDSDYALQMGDSCFVNMDGYMATPEGNKGEPLPNAASGDRVEVVLGTGRYMEGLVEGLVGAKVGESRTVQVSFPDKLRDKSLAGKKAIFDVEVLEASKRIIPEVTDEFANKVRPGLTADSLMEELRKAIDQEDSKEFTPARNKALGEALAQVMDVQVPDTLVTQQARDKFAVMMADMRSNGVADEEIKKQITPENFEKYKAIVKDDIVRDFKVSMATDAIADLEGITVPDYQIEEQMEAIRKDAAENNEEFDETMIRGKVEATLSRQAVMDWLAENGELEVEYQDEEFDEKLLEVLANETMEREQKMSEGAAPVAKAAEPVAAKEPEPVAAEEPEPAKEEPAVPEPTSFKAETEEEKKARYAAMSIEDRAYQALLDAGALKRD